METRAKPPPFPAGQFGVIYADPPWKYKMYSEKGEGRSPDRHYPCMTHEELLAMRDQILFAAAPNSVLIMWTSFSAGNINGEIVDHLLNAMELMRAWGFQRVTAGPWIKRERTGNATMGMGKSFRQSAELFIVGKHGSPRIKNHSTRSAVFTGDVPEHPEDIQSIIVDSLVRDHSQKPDEMIPLIEALFDGPYLELFARTQRPGWTVWGNQTDKFTA